MPDLLVIHSNLPPTYLDISELWTPANSDTYVTGLARGRFKFKGAAPARTHGGLPRQPGVEARIGRELVDPEFSYQDVYYWDEDPRVFQVRNLSGDPVTVEFKGNVCVGFSSHQVLDGETFEFGPCYYPAFGARAVVWVFSGLDPLSDLPTVQSGVDVRVQGSGEADPGESFDFTCNEPAAVQL